MGGTIVVWREGRYYSGMGRDYSEMGGGTIVGWGGGL